MKIQNNYFGKSFEAKASTSYDNNDYVVWAACGLVFGAKQLTHVSCQRFHNVSLSIRWDVGNAYQNVAFAKECIKSARGDESWQKVWSRISQVADSIKVTLVKPRTTTVQRHRANAAHNDQPSDYYRINVFYPFIDHVVGELET